MSSNLKARWREQYSQESQGLEGGTDASYLEWLLEKNLAVNNAILALVTNYLQGGGDDQEDSPGGEETPEA